MGETISDVAEYLLKGELLNKRAIGDYLGEGLVYSYMLFVVVSLNSALLLWLFYYCCLLL